MRPFQLDPSFQPLFTNPNHPAYPSAHSCLSVAAAELMGYLFPRDEEAYRSLAEVIGESRLWAGIQFRSDITVGSDLAQAVAGKMIQYAQNDGSE